MGVDKQDLDRNRSLTLRSSQTSGGMGYLPAAYAAEFILVELDENETAVRAVFVHPDRMGTACCLTRCA